MATQAKARCDRIINDFSKIFSNLRLISLFAAHRFIFPFINESALLERTQRIFQFFLHTLLQLLLIRCTFFRTSFELNFFHRFSLSHLRVDSLIFFTLFVVGWHKSIAPRLYWSSVWRELLVTTWQVTSIVLNLYLAFLNNQGHSSILQTII